jgi:biotin transport system substrate-specific component
MEKNLAYIALFAALIAVLGLVPRIELAAGVPITAQSLGVMLAGTVLGARRGALAVLLFVGLLAAGLPLLSGGANLYAVWGTPRIGFVLGFPAAAFVAGWIVERTTLGVGVAAFAGAVIGGVAVLYAFGLLGMAWRLGIPVNEAALLLAAFLPGDVLKAVIAGVVTASLSRMRPGVLLSRPV